LNADEREQLEENGRRHGRALAGVIVLPIGLVSISFLWSARVGFVSVMLFALYLGVVALPRMRAMRRRSHELICESEWARQRGYTPATLRFFAFPWST